MTQSCHSISRGLVRSSISSGIRLSISFIGTHLRTLNVRIRLTYNKMINNVVLLNVYHNHFIVTAHGVFAFTSLMFQLVSFSFSNPVSNFLYIFSQKNEKLQHKVKVACQGTYKLHNLFKQNEGYTEHKQ